MLPTTSRRLLVSALAAVLMPVLVSACTTQRVSGGGSDEMAAVAPMLSVERFLAAANAGDYEAMARLFGTASGPISGNRAEIELRMDAISRILRHEDYRIVGEASVPGREHPTTRVGVDMTIGSEVVPNVAFHVVRTEGGRWMVQEIDLEAITNR
jgi:hypothetical protein